MENVCCSYDHETSACRPKGDFNLIPVGYPHSTPTVTPAVVAMGTLVKHAACEVLIPMESWMFSS